MSFYRALLRLYPSSFRAEYGDELAATFAAQHVRANTIVALFAAIADVIPNATAVHWDILRADLRHAARTLRRSPSFAITAILVVALGVGANTAAFSVADFVLIRPLPFPSRNSSSVCARARPAIRWNFRLGITRIGKTARSRSPR